MDNVLKLKRLEEENRDLRQRVGKHEIVYTGETMRRVMAQVDRVAASESRVCILGETGTGKELIARALHERSPRREGPFVTLNCAAVPGELIESELFGHEKGSFTGAASRHTGKFEQANRGTLFLDEIGDMPVVMQAKLLRVLEERQVERVGGDRAIPVDVRVVVATHRNLDELVRKGGFREDLYHRLYVFPLLLPALRDRAEDIPALVAHFAAQVAAQNGWKPKPYRAGRHRRSAALPLARKRARVAQRGGAAAAIGRWTGGPRGGAPGAAAIRRRRRAGGRAALRRSAGRPRGRLRARADPGRAQAPQPAHDRHRQIAGPGAQPSVQEVPGAGDRPAGAEEAGGVRKEGQTPFSAWVILVGAWTSSAWRTTCGSRSE